MNECFEFTFIDEEPEILDFNFEFIEDPEPEIIEFTFIDPEPKIIEFNFEFLIDEEPETISRALENAGYNISPEVLINSNALRNSLENQLM